MNVLYRNDLSNVDWSLLKSALAADDFDNGRTPQQLEQSFKNSHAVCIAWQEQLIVGAGRVLSDGICNAYLIDLWTLSRFRRQGIAREMVTRLKATLSGQHLYLQADNDLLPFYHRLGFAEQPSGMSCVIGKWLDNQPAPP